MTELIPSVNYAYPTKFPTNADTDIKSIFYIDLECHHHDDVCLDWFDAQDIAISDVRATYRATIPMRYVSRHQAPPLSR